MLAALLLTTAFAPLAQTFDEPVRIDGPISDPEVAAVADLDGDGLDDTVIFDSESGAVMWARSRPGAGPGGDAGGSPSLNSASFVTLFTIDGASGLFGVQILQLLAADFNGDGDLDVAALVAPNAQGEPAVFVGLNDGSGAMDDVRSYGSPAHEVLAMEAVDLTATGLPGILVVGRTPSFVGVSYFHRPLGNGVLSGPVPLFVGQGPGTNGLRKGDLDGDGDEDLILVNASPAGNFLDPELLALPNTGSLPLDPASAVSLAGPLRDVQVGDVGGDGLVDLVTLPFFPQVPIVPLINQGGFSFAPDPGLPAPATGYYESLALGDLEGDGDLDVVGNVQGAPLGDGVDAFENQGGAFVRFSGVAASDGPLRALVAGEMTGDGLLDLVGVRGTSFDRELLYAQAGSTPFSFSRFQNLGESFGRGFIGTIHANSDGIADLLVVSEAAGALGEGALAVKLALGGGRFGPAYAVSAPGTPSGPGSLGLSARRVWVGDFDGDGLEDIAATNEAEDAVLLFLGLGAGQFTDGAPALAIPGIPAHAEVEDLDGDGADDLVYTTPTGSAVFYAFGDASGSFVDRRSITGGFPQAVAPRAADVDGDGDMDLLYLVSDRVEVSLNAGARLFASRVTLADGVGALVREQVLPADIDLDGLLDVVVPGRWFYRGIGNGLFDAPVAIQGIGVSSGRTDAVDLDLDGDLDLVMEAGTYLFPAVAWAESVGPLTWLSRGALGPTGAFSPLGGGDLGDLDGDGDLDAVSGTADGLLFVMLNSTLGRVGSRYCGAAIPNSTGAVGALFAVGSTDLGVSRLTLRAEDLPAQAAGYFLTSRTQDDVAAVPGSLGRLCVGGSVGRLIGPGQVQSSGAAGVFQLELDLSALPDPAMGLIPVQAGETWNFQGWHRDLDSIGALTSNFTEAVSVGF